MINNNKIYFGYGTILIIPDICGLSLQHIKPPQKIGPIESEEGIEFGKKITFTDFTALCKLLNQINKVNILEVEQIFTIGKYEIIFPAGADQSLSILRKAVNRAISNLTLASAC